jgi:hypothetical protein
VVVVPAVPSNRRCRLRSSDMDTGSAALRYGAGRLGLGAPDGDPWLRTMSRSCTHRHIGTRTCTDRDTCERERAAEANAQAHDGTLENASGVAMVALYTKPFRLGLTGGGNHDGRGRVAGEGGVAPHAHDEPGERAPDDAAAGTDRCYAARRGTAPAGARGRAQSPRGARAARRRQAHACARQPRRYDRAEPHWPAPHCLCDGRGLGAGLWLRQRQRRWH